MELTLSKSELAELLETAAISAIKKYEETREEYLTTKEAAGLLRVTPRTIVNYLDDGLLKRYYVGGGKQPRIKRSEVMALPRAKQVGLKKVA